jgi:RHS repeat-associated protein
VYRADGLRVKKVWHTPIEVAPAEAVASGPSKVRTEEEEAKPVYIGHEVDYLYDGQMPVCEQEYEDGVLQQTRVNFLGARGIEAVVTVDHTRGNQVALRWLLYDGHGNLVRTMAPNYTLSAFQWRGVWGEVQGSLGTGRGYCANLGHPEDETGLVYMRARYYEPATGRFISEDPARDGVNWYLYADGNPVGKVDDTGEFSLPTALWLGIIQGLISGFINFLKNKSFWTGFAGGFIAGFITGGAPHLWWLAPALGAAVRAALEGQNVVGIIKAAGIAGGGAILARLAIYGLLVDALNDEELVIAQRLLGITFTNLGEVAFSVWELIGG